METGYYSPTSDAASLGLWSPRLLPGVFFLPARFRRITTLLRIRFGAHTRVL